MANYNDLASTYANQKRAEYENSLGYLTSDAAAANTAAVNTINTQYNNLVSAINAKRQDVADTYENEAQQAYINKLLAGRQLGTTLSQLGLNTQGMGVQQQLANETAYGQNLATLQANRDKGIRDIEAQITQTEGERATALAGQAGKYADALAQANLQKQQMADQYYNQQYSNYLADLQYQDQLKQQDLENKLAQAKFNEQVKQQAIENNIAKQQLALQQAAARNNNSNNKGTLLQTAYYNDYMTDDQLKAIHNYGTFNTADKNGTRYQPKGVVVNGHDYGELKSTGKTAGSLYGKNITNSSDVNIANQKVWQTKDGQYWIWNGSKMTYEPIG